MGSVLELLVMKIAAECTSQRLKWTSGARVMIIFDRCSFPDVLPETMKMFDYSVFEFPFSDIIWGVFEFRISFPRPIYLGAFEFQGSKFRFFLSDTIFLFVDAALRAASILKNNVFCISCMSSKCQNSFIWLDLSIKSMLELLVLKNAVEFTSQRLNNGRLELEL